jgi:putative MATE family efflux protein
MDYNEKYDLTRGGILVKLLRVAGPIVGMNFLQMAYNLTDMFWLGRVGADAVAASGAAGMYLWLSTAFMLAGRMGAEIGVAQSVGRGERETARSFSQNALALSCAMGVAFGAVMVVFHGSLARFFGLHETAVVNDTAAYIMITGFGIPFTFITAVFAGTFSAAGNARAPFVVTGLGLALNAALDPLFIFVAGLGVRGAAVATASAQVVVACLMALAIRLFHNRPFARYPFRFTLSGKRLVQILKWGVPVGVETLCFCFLTMLCTRLEAGFGADAVAAGKIGVQLESLTWLIGTGAGSALVAFIGQNYGAGKRRRIKAGVRAAAVLLIAWGTLATIALVTAGRTLFALFLPAERLQPLGALYISIFVFCQLPMCLEAVGSGAFKGFGHTIPPSFVSFAGNLLKPTLGYVLSGPLGLGLMGVWIGVCTPDVLRGIALCAWYLAVEKRLIAGAVRDTPPATDT